MRKRKLGEDRLQSLLGIQLDSVAEGATSTRWRALAVGDSCLFQIRVDELVLALPDGKRGRVWYDTALALHAHEYNCRVLKELRTRDGEVSAGDLLLLATDAFAACSFSGSSPGRSPGRI